MKILKRGITFHCVCEKCNCEFVAAKEEALNCGFFYKIECPDCGNEIHFGDPIVDSHLKDNVEKSKEIGGYGNV